jgi:hypothetical protein
MYLIEKEKAIRRGCARPDGSSAVSARDPYYAAQCMLRQLSCGGRVQAGVHKGKRLLYAAIITVRTGPVLC